MAYSQGYHNGPECEKCGYHFCEHCRDEPDCDCPVSDEAWVAKLEKQAAALQARIDKARDMSREKGVK
jgi:predicted nucleic acid binding AN1-type Zn finger protein